MRIAVVGSGISGLGCAWLLSQRHEVTLYEAEPRLGGHSHTFEIVDGDRRIPVDTGFIVYNERNYPNLTRLFGALDVPTQPSDMSFGVSVGGGRIEYCGSGPRSLFAQSGNLLNLDFHRMLLDIVRFNREGQAALERPIDDAATLGDFLDRHGFRDAFRQHYLLPMAAAIWSGSTAGMLDFPLFSFLRFFANHGLLTVNDQPDWRTVTGGSRIYVERLTRAMLATVRPSSPVVRVRRAGDTVEVHDQRGGLSFFDQVVLACHADQALDVLETPSAGEREILGSFAYRQNLAVLHRDAALMPKRRAAWASWNYVTPAAGETGKPTGVTYWMNRLQGIDPTYQVFVSLNPMRPPVAHLEIARFTYAHPQFTTATLRAQRRLVEIQGRDKVWFAGAHWGYGFHEDGLRSGLEVAAGLGVRPPWWRAIGTGEGGAAISLPLPAAAKPE
ncbi:MAG: FAD-dependent oxidoreductase [Geminicoccaceae bacterium]|nr:FAD-dependent oxidoreductase [Geminicoccaceae bacterium]